MSTIALGNGLQFLPHTHTHVSFGADLCPQPWNTTEGPHTSGKGTITILNKVKQLWDGDLITWKVLIFVVKGESSKFHLFDDLAQFLGQTTPTSHYRGLVDIAFLQRYRSVDPPHQRHIHGTLACRQNQIFLLLQILSFSRKKTFQMWR